MVATYGLYVHIPFCKRKCDYCHFYVTRPSNSREELLLKGLRKEWEGYKPLIQGKALKTVYFGGGTPSQAKTETLAEILSWLDLSRCEEITLEVNPDDVTPSYAKAIKGLGIDRISLGVQTLSDPLLKAIGRSHSSDKALEAIATLASAGFTNLSIDLMLDLPHQTLTTARQTLNRIQDLPLTHVSLYNLLLEPPSTFYNNRHAVEKEMPRDQESLTMLEETVTTLESYGLKRYEISAFAIPGFEARHNTGYWTGQPFLGLGPSAFSYWEGRRFRNIANLEEYARREDPVDFEERLEEEAAWRERFVIALRLIQGVDLKTLGRPPFLNLEPLIQQGLLKRDNSIISLTDHGRLFYDTVASELVV